MLGLHPWASHAEIRRVYRKLARRFHPDGTEPNERLFARYAEIYAVLSDPVRRAEYHSVPEGDLLVDRHVIELLERLGRPVPKLEQVTPTQGYDYYRIGSHHDDDATATRWYEILIHDLGRLGYRKVVKLCLSDSNYGFDISTRVLTLPRVSQDQLPAARVELLSILS